MKVKNLTLSILVSTLIISCKGNKEEQKISFISPLVSNRDTTINAADDFFNYANGGWFKRNPIPESETTNGIFLAVKDSVNNVVRIICEKAAKENSAAVGSNTQKIGDFFYSASDTLNIEKDGLSSLDKYINEIDKLSKKEEIAGLLASLTRIATGPFFGIYVGRDEKNSSLNSVSVYQGGIGLPDREYYFGTDSRTKSIRDKYKNHLLRFMSFSFPNEKDSLKSSQNIYSIEEKLANVSRKLENLRDPYKNYNKMSFDALQKSTPNFDWKTFLSGINLTNVDSIIVGQPEFIIGFNAILKNSSIDEIKNYLKFHLIGSYAEFLNKKIKDQDFYFYETVLSGTKTQKPRWKQAVEQTNKSLGELIGQEYVKDYLPANTKEKFKEIGDNIIAVFKEHLLALDWMSEETKKKALVKLSTINMKLGYPDKWKDYSKLEVSRKSYCLNVINANVWAFEDMTKKFGKPVDRTEWNMTPQTYNAYYDPTLNEFVIPGCNIIVPGYQGMPPDAVLYGIIGGGTFGHEITHGFDDQGSQFDEKGNLNNWWTKEDREKFTAKTKLLIEQYNGYTVLDSLHVNGAATLGENIADLGGCIMGYEAFKKTTAGKADKGECGFTPDQEYFLGFAYGWMVQRRPENLAKQIMTDVHSPAMFRINGPMSNMPEFYRAFDVKPENKMYRDEKIRVKIW
jgi:putative endopeptidase